MKRFKAVFAVLALALGVKLVYLHFSRQSPFYEPHLLDPEHYHRWALRIVGGDWAGEGVFYGLPLYPFFLALCYKLFQNSIFAAKLVQALLGLVTLYFVYKAGEKIDRPLTGLLAASLGAVYGPLFFHEQIFIPEALGLPLYAASFYAALCFSEKPTPRSGALLGILLGLSTLTKAGILVFMALFLSVLLARNFGKPRGVAAVFSCLVLFVLALLPVTLHNVVHGKDLVLLSSHGGFNFYVGNNPKSEGVFVAPEGTGSNVTSQIQDSRNVAEHELGRRLKPSEVSRYWSGKAARFIRENPGRFLWLSWRKLLLFFDAREISDVDDYAFGARFNPMLRFPWPNFALLGPLVFLGFLAAWRSRHRLWILLWVGGYLSGLLAFFINARYRLPLLSVFFVLAAMGLVDLYESWSRQRWGRFFAALLLAAAGVFVTRLELVGTIWARDYVNAGDVYVLKKDYEKAMEFYEEALRRDPDSPKATHAKALLLTRTGRYDEAKEYYQKAIALEPGNSQAYNNLGLWYDRNGDLDSAERHFLRALALNPNSSQAHNNLGMVYGKRGENQKAIREFEAALKLNPANARFYTNLGLVLYRLGHVAQARDLWKRALELDPEFEEAKRALQLLENRL